MNYTIPKSALVAHTALTALLEAVDDPDRRTVALKLVRESYDLGLRDQSVEQRLIRGAQARILGEKVWEKDFIPVSKPADRSIFETFAKAWLTWAEGQDPEAVLDDAIRSDEYGGAIHIRALEAWGKAIRALKLEDGEGAVRFFRRSMELGEQYALETSDAIQWSYAASVFHRGT